MKKVVISVHMVCEKCKRKAMKTVSSVEGVDSVTVDSSKNTVTVIGEVDAVEIMTKLRKFRKSAQIVSVGPNTKEEKENDNKDKCVSLPTCCRSCEIWYVDDKRYYQNDSCSIM
ncbi:hypothetical protein SUGI_0365520 [Cryptomeria japonica]|nr:hypothetical protein SUGI_0365520 [Cryptomeria japonica]